MGKKGRSRQKNEKRNGKTSSQYDDALNDDMHDEIDAFHKQSDIIPLDIHGDVGESDEDEEVPVFDLKGSDDDEDEFDDDDFSDDVNDDMTRKIIRQRKYLRAKFGGEDEMHDDDNEEEDDDEPILVGKHSRHGADNRHFELQSSDDEALKEEEELANQLQRERAKFYTEEDYDLVGLKESSFKGRDSTESLMLEDTDKTYKVEDLNALSKDEQMETLNRSYPELVFWLSELNDAHDQLECKINPLLSKVKDGKIATEGVGYFELKKALLLLYCQAITFYLLLKSEGKPVHDHPVMARLEEIKKLLDRVQKLDAKLPVKVDDVVEENHGLKMVLNSGDINASMADSFVENHDLPHASDVSLKETVSLEVVEMQNVDSSKDNVNEERKQRHELKKDRIGVQSSEMLKIRASLEEKLKQKGFHSSIAPKTTSARKRSRSLNGLDTCDDFDDDNVNADRVATLVNGLGSGRIAQLAHQKKVRVVSGDDDLPKRDDIGERRRKFELRAMSGAGLKSEDVDEEIGDPGFSDQEDETSEDSENDLYEQIKQQRAERLAAKAKIYSRNSEVPYLPGPDTLDKNGRRPISYEMEKNRGLTRYRKKLTKNPRKKYKEKHKKALKRRSGQVRSVKKPTGSYGGEFSGINPSVSRSVRIKS
ncbi:something about silencing protein 10 [Neltuma alba]|uniref:something about silencing protein 10 n=1 Tax=Neltuma alba TaxID=207710 RepID=UPI0010A4F0DA|nr:something about silencing protein 10-like [Prosopis alba]XP_028752867.1 something about silencing protein 10-like [Prosopis alba]